MQVLGRGGNGYPDFQIKGFHHNMQRRLFNTEDVQKEFAEYWGSISKEFKDYWNLLGRRRKRAATKRAFDPRQIPLTTELSRNEPFPMKDPTLSEFCAPIDVEFEGCSHPEWRRYMRMQGLKDLGLPIPQEYYSNPPHCLRRWLRSQSYPQIYSPDVYSQEQTFASPFTSDRNYSQKDLGYPFSLDETLEVSGKEDTLQGPGRGLSRRRQMREERRRQCPYSPLRDRLSASLSKQSDIRKTVERVDERRRLFELKFFPVIGSQFRYIIEENRMSLLPLKGMTYPLPTPILDTLSEKWEQSQRAAGLEPSRFTAMQLQRIQDTWDNVWRGVSITWKDIEFRPKEVEEIEVSPSLEPSLSRISEPYEPRPYPRYVPPEEIKEEIDELDRELRSMGYDKYDRREFRRMFRNMRSLWYNPQARQPAKHPSPGVKPYEKERRQLERGEVDIKELLRRRITERREGIPEKEPKAITIEAIEIPENLSKQVLEGWIIRFLHSNWGNWLLNLQNLLKERKTPKEKKEKEEKEEVVWAKDPKMLALLLLCASRALSMTPADVKPLLTLALKASGGKVAAALLEDEVAIRKQIALLGESYDTIGTGPISLSLTPVVRSTQ